MTGKPLTKRQKQVLYLVSLGLTREAVASQLGIKFSTVHTTLRYIFKRLEVFSAAEAVRVGFETGVLTPREDPTNHEAAVAVARDYGSTPERPAQADQVGHGAGEHTG